MALVRNGSAHLIGVADAQYNATFDKIYNPGDTCTGGHKERSA